MLVFCTFEQSLELESVLARLEGIGIAREDMLAVPMDPVSSEAVGSIIHVERSATVFDVGMAAATAAAVVGMSVGFVLAWGPIICGLLFAAAGFLAGAVIRMLLNKRSIAKRRDKLGDSKEVTVVINCTREKLDAVRKTIEHYGAITVGVVRR
jgi:hypothetical protein